MNNNRPQVGVAVFVLKSGKFVMLQRQGSHGNGSWAPPGGHLEFGESWMSCAVRETREEVGLEINNIRFLAVTNDIFKGKASNKHYITIFMRADWVSGEAKICEPDKCQALGWFSYQSMPPKIFLPLSNLQKLYPELSLA